MARGRVHTTSAMVCEPDDRRRVGESAGSAPGRIGLHLQLTDGCPLCPPGRVPSLVDGRGRFPDGIEGVGRLDPAEVLAEWRAQLACLRDLGVEPSHLDSHQHVHLLPGAIEAYIELARETGLPARGSRPLIARRLEAVGRLRARACQTRWSGGECSIASLVEALRSLLDRESSPTTIELVCHPGYVDDRLRARSKYVESRRRELAVLCDPDLERRLAEIGVSLAGPDGFTAGPLPGRAGRTSFV
jgi:chitin disaccharide deacetylase